MTLRRLNTIQGHSLVRRAAGVTETESKDGMFLVDPRRGRLYGLDACGKAIWVGLANPIHVDELCVRLNAEFFVDAATIQRDVIELLNGLLRNGLIRVSPGSFTSEGQ